ECNCQRSKCLKINHLDRLNSLSFHKSFLACDLCLYLIARKAFYWRYVILFYWRKVPQTQHMSEDSDVSDTIEGIDTLNEKTITPNKDIETETPSRKQDLRRATISIVLEDYDSAFSDFDPRP